jgi:phosphoglycerol transferase
MVVIALVWAHHYHLFGIQRLSEPLEYAGDAWFSAAAVKTAMVGDWVPFLPKRFDSLGAPFPAVWSDFPIPEVLVFVPVGWLARLVGLFTALNLSYVWAAMAAGVSLYAVARYLRARREVAVPLAILFGLSRFLFHRTLHHYNLIFYWHVPLGLLVAFWAASRKGLTGRRFPVAVAVALITSLYNPYFVNFFLQGLGLATAARCLKLKSWRAAKPSLLLLGVVLAGGFLANWDTLTYTLQHGPNPSATARDPADIERFALKPFELVFPQVPHVIGWVNEMARRHAVIIHSEYEYIGLFASLCLLWLLFRTVKSLLEGTVTGEARLGLLALWLMAFGIVGGMNSILGAIGIPLFRSSNRASIVIMAIALLFAARRLTVLTRKLHRGWVLLGAAVVVAFGPYEQIFPKRTEGEIQSALNQARSDADLVTRLEARVSPNARIFQLPPVDFPEVSFEPFRPYLHAKHLTFSFGGMKGRPEARWQFTVANLPPAEMLRTLEEAGFSAVYLQRNAYPADQLAQAFAALGRTERLESPSRDTLVVLLHPSSTPKLPTP